MTLDQFLQQVYPEESQPNPESPAEPIARKTHHLENRLWRNRKPQLHPGIKESFQ
jgi:hypothetical protein